jgi:hypothetical protein
MLLLTSVSDLVQVVTGSAGTILVHASWIDNASGTITPGRTNTAAISTSATTTVVAAPAGSTQRNVKFLSVNNTHATVSNAVIIQHTDGTTVTQIWDGVLLPGEQVHFDDTGDFTLYSASGVIKQYAPNIVYNASTAAQGAGFAADTYLAGSSVLLPGPPKVGTRYHLKFDVSKTAAGTATPILIVRVGTAGAVGDAAILTFTWGAGTAAADIGTVEVDAAFRAVGAGTSAVLQGRAQIVHGVALGIINLNGVTLQVTSGGFNSTVANSIIGASFNGGLSFSGTVQLVAAELTNF